MLTLLHLCFSTLLRLSVYPSILFLSIIMGIETRSKSSSQNNPDEVFFTRDEVLALVQKNVERATQEITAMFNDKMNALRHQVLDLETELNRQKRINNKLEQYSRRSNIRIYGLKIKDGEDCKTVVADFLSKSLKGRDGRTLTITRKDIDAAHPLPVRRLTATIPKAAASSSDQASAPKPVTIVRFHERETRDWVAAQRRSLKGLGISISDDLTHENANLLKKLANNQHFTKSWSWQGAIWAIPTGAKKPKRMDIDDVI